MLEVIGFIFCGGILVIFTLTTLVAIMIGGFEMGPLKGWSLVAMLCILFTDIAAWYQLLTKYCPFTITMN